MESKIHFCNRILKVLDKKLLNGEWAETVRSLECGRDIRRTKLSPARLELR